MRCFRLLHPGPFPLRPLSPVLPLVPCPCLRTWRPRCPPFPLPPCPLPRWSTARAPMLMWRPRFRRRWLSARRSWRLLLGLLPHVDSPLQPLPSSLPPLLPPNRPPFPPPYQPSRLIPRPPRSSVPARTEILLTVRCRAERRRKDAATRGGRRVRASCRIEPGWWKRRSSHSSFPGRGSG